MSDSETESEKTSTHDTSANETSTHDTTTTSKTSDADTSKRSSDVVSGLKSRLTSKLSTVADENESREDPDETTTNADKTRNTYANDKEDDEEDEDEERSEAGNTTKTGKSRVTSNTSKKSAATSSANETETENDDNEEEEDSDDDSDEEEEEENESSEGEYEAKSSQRNSSTMRSTAQSRSLGNGSQMTDRLSSHHRTPIDQNLTLNQSFAQNDLSVPRYGTKKLPKNFKLKRYFNSKNEPIYPISLSNMYQFEKDLFELLGFPAQDNIDEEELENKKIHKLREFDDMQCQSTYIADTRALYYDLDFTNPYEPKLVEKKKQANEKKNAKRADRLKNEPMNENRPAKVITTVLSGAVRPRKAARLLLTKRNTATLDQVLEAICDSLKVESINVKRLYTLKGREVLKFHYEILF